MNRALDELTLLEDRGKPKRKSGHGIIVNY